MDTNTFPFPPNASTVAQLVAYAQERPEVRYIIGRYVNPGDYVIDAACVEYPYRWVDFSDDLYAADVRAYPDAVDVWAAADILGLTDRPDMWRVHPGAFA